VTIFGSLKVEQVLDAYFASADGAGGGASFDAGVGAESEADPHEGEAAVPHEVAAGVPHEVPQVVDVLQQELQLRWQRFPQRRWQPALRSETLKVIATRATIALKRMMKARVIYPLLRTMCWQIRPANSPNTV
jgi:hypothetical protein